MAPFYVRSTDCKFSPHLEGTNDDFAPYMERSHADFASHMEESHIFRDQQIAKIAKSAIYFILFFQTTHILGFI